MATALAAVALALWLPASAAHAAILVGAMGDSYSDETAPAFGIPNWVEVLVAGGRADFGPFASFPSGDPRHTGGFGSYTYNFAKGGATTTSALGSTQVAGSPPVLVQHYRSQPGSPNAPHIWPGVRGAGLSGAIQYASQEIGGNDLLGMINSGHLRGGLDAARVDGVLGRFEQIAQIASAEFSSPLRMVLVTYPDLGSMPIFGPSGLLPLATPERDSVRANADYFNQRVRALAAEHDWAVVELWDLWERLKSPGVSVHGIPIEPHALGVGGPQDLHTAFLGDGLHPTPIFQALWANEFLRAVNDHYGESIPLLTSKELATLSLLDPQDPPTAHAGGAYEISAHQSLLLDAAASFDPDAGDADYLSYRWDLNGDGVFTDATGVAPEVSWSELAALGVNVVDEFLVRVEVDDSFGGVAISPATTLRVAPLDGDLNLDGNVDIFDVALVSAHWGQAGPAGDANNDGHVDIFDVATVSQNWTVSQDWTASQQAAAVPEPHALTLATLALLLAALRLHAYSQASRLPLSSKQRRE